MRGLMSLIVINFHSLYLFGGKCIFPLGALAVEFFFLLSGFLLAGSVARCAERSLSQNWALIHQENHALIYRRICSFFPELVISCLIAGIVYVLSLDGLSYQALKRLYLTYFQNALLLKMSGLFSGYGLNGASWYLSTLLMCTAILYPIMRRWGNSIVYCVIGLLLLSALCAGDAEHYYTPTTHLGYILKGNLRGFAEMMIGASLYPVVVGVRHCVLTRLGQVMMTFLKWCCLFIFILYVVWGNHIKTGIGIPLLALCVMLVLIFSKKCLDAHWYQHEVFLFLGRFALPLYLSHEFYAQIFHTLLPMEWPAAEKLCLYNVCAVVTALLVMVLAKWMRASKKYFVRETVNPT